MSSQKPNIIQQYVDNKKDPRMTFVQLHDATRPTWNMQPLIRLLNKLRTNAANTAQQCAEWADSTRVGRRVRQKLARS